ncbi:cytoplasmic protein [Lentinula aff. lateritia]|uniref:Cytoplasmic protein n=1 Tax=Lentinula aff. lateritia TaxID=2804960 RepID=A0ACC1UFE8_9AGAR|nr:cytoplasmic protein [Lentinula aff. lateritia]
MDPPFVSSDSPPLRSTILGSFLGRGRPRNSSQSHVNPSSPNPDPLRRETSPSPNPPSPSGQATGSLNHRRGRPAGTGNATSAVSAEVGNGVQPSTSAPGAGLAFSMLRRRRSAGTMANANNVNTAGAPSVPTGVPSRPPTAPNVSATNLRSISTNAAANRIPASLNTPPHRLRLVPHLESRRSLRFDAITRDMRVGDPALRIGRFTDRSGNNPHGGGVNNNNPNSFKLAFKSKVVSRAHAELWTETSSPSSAASPANVKFFIKDTKSSSGTFLNHVRLSPANTESRPFQIKDGDILQLGVDYQGGSEDIYKSVKIRVEIGREWQSGANKFNTTAIKNLKSLAQAVSGVTGTSGPGKPKSAGLPDCCICLFPIAINQALFISPCSHTFHFKCIRPMIETHFPSWSCPLCRSFADLEEDVEVEAEMDYDIEEKDEDADVELEADGIAAQPNGAAAPGVPIAEDDDSAVEEIDGAETEVESDHIGGSTLRPARNQRRGHGRNPSAQLVDPIATEGMDEEQDEDGHENDVEMLVDVDGQPEHDLRGSHAEADAMNHDEDMEFGGVAEVRDDAELEGRSSGSGMSEGDAAVGAAGAKRKR